MIQTLASRLLSWLVQQLAVPLSPLLWGILTFRSEESLAASLGLSLNGIVDVSCFVGLGISFGLAILVRHIVPSAVAMGRWIWLLPVLIWGSALIYDSLTLSTAEAVADFFWSSRGDDGGLLMFFTYPTCSCIVYSAGMMLADRRAKRKLSAAGVGSFASPRV